MSLAVEIRELVVQFGENRVLKGIDLEIASGEIFAIMGSSGGGKTTLLRCIAGLQDPTSGSVLVDGVDVKSQAEAARKKMGLVFQSAALFDFMSVLENVEFGLERVKERLPRSEIRKRSLAALEQVGLADAAQRLPDELSGGMRKRVGIARARVLEPCLMLYDEPTTGLDPTTTYAIDELIRGVSESDEVTSILVSHDLNSVLRVADRVAFLHQGQIVYLGSNEGFLKSDHPAIIDLVTKTRSTALA